MVTADRQFGQSVEEGDFPKAIESVLECRSVVGQYKQYQSVVDLMNTLQVHIFNYKNSILGQI